MSDHRCRVLAARWIIPVSSPPIHGGWVRIIDGRIAELGTGEPPSLAEDLGDVAILPRLVNSHTHLEFSACERPIGEPGIPLSKWIGLVVASRATTTHSDKKRAVELGLAEIRESGTTLVGEITTPPTEYPSSSGRPKLVTFAEVLGLNQRRSEERLAAAAQHVASLPQGAFSPHAPYSVAPDTIERVVALAKSHDRMIAMHVAESPEERELLVNGTGSLAEALMSLGVWQDGIFPWADDPYCGLIDRLAAAKSVLLVHGNDLNSDEVQHLGAHRNVTVVFCPRTHHRFRFHRHPVASMLAAGIRVALGTDSRASNPDLNLWREVQFLLRERSDLDPGDVIQMATLNGAKALGHSRLGAIAPQCCGELGYVTTQASTLDHLYTDLCDHDFRLVDDTLG